MIGQSISMQNQDGIEVSGIVSQCSDTMLVVLMADGTFVMMTTSVSEPSSESRIKLN